MTAGPGMARRARLAPAKSRSVDASGMRRLSQEGEERPALERQHFVAVVLPGGWAGERREHRRQDGDRLERRGALVAHADWWDEQREVHRVLVLVGLQRHRHLAAQLGVPGVDLLLGVGALAVRAGIE